MYTVRRIGGRGDIISGGRNPCHTGAVAIELIWRPLTEGYIAQLVDYHRHNNPEVDGSNPSFSKPNHFSNIPSQFPLGMVFSLLILKSHLMLSFARDTSAVSSDEIASSDVIVSNDVIRHF